MKVGALVVGAVIGGAVWVFALRATSAAATDTVGSPTDSPPPPEPDGNVRDAQGNIVSTVGQSPPIIAPPAASDCSIAPGDMQAIASAASDQTVVSANVTVAGVNGTIGSALPLQTDPINQTVKEDTTHSLGGQGVEQMAATSAGMAARPIETPPSYADGGVAYVDFLKARHGCTDGMTRQQINEAIKEAAAMGGLTL